METVWWVFSQIAKQGLVYRGMKVSLQTSRLAASASGNFARKATFPTAVPADVKQRHTKACSPPKGHLFMRPWQVKISVSKASKDTQSYRLEQCCSCQFLMNTGHALLMEAQYHYFKQ